MRNAAILANLSVLSTFVVAAILFACNEPLYFKVVQEDSYLEWATFWGFSIAAVNFSVCARLQFKVARRLPWFLIGLVLFCIFVALEEISWGQRLFGYSAPDFFLEQNFQQEINFHNVIPTSGRKLAMQVILLGYGVILSIVNLAPPIRLMLARMRIVAPSAALIVSFLTMFIIYSWYPWSHTGEWVEFAMACGFAYAGLFSAAAIGVERDKPLARAVLIFFSSVWIFAASTVFATRYVYAADHETVDLARREIQSLSADFRSAFLHTRCGTHKRLYTFMHEYQQPYLLKGEFARLLQNSGNAARAKYLLDPWNSAYWIRHKCAAGREVTFVYSFGPNRRRDSTEWEIQGNDIGAYLTIEQ